MKANCSGGGRRGVGRGAALRGGGLGVRRHGTYLALWFKDQGHESWFYWYVTLLIFLSAVV